MYYVTECLGVTPAALIGATTLCRWAKNARWNEAIRQLSLVDLTAFTPPAQKTSAWSNVMLQRSSRALCAHLGAAARHQSVAAAQAANAEALPEDWATAKPYDHIPGPKPYPIIGNLHVFIPGFGSGKFDFLGLHNKLWAEYGDMVRISKLPGRRDMLVLFDPEAAEKVFRNEGKWPIREGIHTLTYYRTVTRKEKYEGAAGIVASQGKDWHDFRSKVNQPLMQPRSARRYFGPIDEVAGDFIGRMRALRDEKYELPANFMNEFYKWSLESIALVALDTRLGCLNPSLAKDSVPQRMIDSVQVVFDAFYELDIKPSLWRLISTPMWRKLVRAFDYFYDVSEKFVNDAIARRNKEGGDREPSILERLMANDPQVAKVMASDLLFAGVDTTSNASVALLFYLAKNPHEQRKLGEEIRKALPTRESPVTEEALNEMPYLKACLKESMRLFPIAMGNLRQTPHEIVLRGYQIPKGVEVFVNHMVMSRNEKYFPQAMSFIPERWVRGSPQAHTTSPFVSLPFGFGPRSCVGRRFAELEIYTLVAKVIRNFWVEYHYGDEITFQPRSINSITLPLKFRLTDHQ